MTDGCGGCALSDVPLEEQLARKRAAVIAALRESDITAEVADCMDAHGAGRRRATFHARRGEDSRLRVGFAEARTHNIVDLAEHNCPILLPALQRAAEPVRHLAQHLTGLKKPIDAVVTETKGGLDIDLRGAGKVAEKLRLGLVEIAGRERLARLSLHGDVVIEFRPPVVMFGRAEVILPPGGFLQATELGEETLAKLVLDGVSGAKKVADLFAGCGTFALRIAANAEVKAVEQDRSALAALDRAWRNTPGLKKIEHEGRDLFRRPLTVSELNEFDAVVFDPPRAGAEAQAREIARSKVKRVVAVSCNAETFARDLKVLVSGGYKIGTVTPVDQFRHSSHVEAVAVLTR
jgi:23S rRNA (uracil1939-C5)-methyltransferase